MITTDMKNKNRFWKIYFRITSVVVLALVIGLAVFNDFIRAYEIAQPSTAASRYAESITESEILSMLEETLTDSSSGFNSKEATIAAYMQALPEDGYTCTRILTMGNTEHPVYGLYCNGVLLAHVTLEQGEKGSYGFRPWDVSDVMLDVMI